MWRRLGTRVTGRQRIRRILGVGVVLLLALFVIALPLSGPSPARDGAGGGHALAATQPPPPSVVVVPPPATPEVVVPPPSPPPTRFAAGRRWFALRTEPRSGPALHYRDEYDPLPPWPGESPISFEAYLDCLAARLQVDRAARVELPIPESDWPESFPYLAVPVTAELGHVRALMCNITVPIRRLLYVQNFALMATDAFFDDVQRAFDFTDRLRVVRCADNLGFAGTVNLGARDALARQPREVPFFTIGNNDVRFPPGVLRAQLRRFHAATAGDEAVLSRLEAEVAAEPSEHTPPGHRAAPLRSRGTDTYLVTSRLLPDRVRYAPEEERRRAFVGHAGALFFDEAKETAFLGMPRLALETAGYWDENFYPAYYEDTDFYVRMTRLGFSDVVPDKGEGSSIHLRNAVLRAFNQANEAAAITDPSATDSVVPTTHLPTDLAAVHAEQRALFKSLGLIIGQHLSLTYMRVKWTFPEVEVAVGPFLISPAPPVLPMDCWVWDPRRREAIAAVTQLLIQYFTAHPDEVANGAIIRRLSLEDMALIPLLRASVSSFLPDRYMDNGVLKRLP